MTRPTVTAVVTAYQCAPYLQEALESALGQDYPEELLDVVVVDDGSTDATAAVIAAVDARHPGRLTVIRQANAGYVAATNAGLARARGRLVALLDGDDAWPSDRVRACVAHLDAHPGAALLYGDMTVVGADGAVLQSSWLDGEAEPPEGRCALRLLPGNVATSSSVVVRRDLLDEIGPIPHDAPFADWWLAVRAAEVAGVTYLAAPRPRYRFHGSNMSLGTEGATRRRELGKAAALQRWFLRRLAPDAGAAHEVLAVWRAFERNVREALALAGTPFAATLEVSDADRALAPALAAHAATLADPGEARAMWVRAAATDPWCPGAREGVLRACA